MAVDSVHLPDQRPQRHPGRLMLGMALLLGLLLWFLIDNHPARSPRHWLAAAAVAIVFAVTPLRRLAMRVAGVLQSPHVLARVGLPAIVFLLSIGYLLWHVHAERRLLIVSWHDEFSYLLQAQMFAEGVLWLPPPAAPDSFDTFYVLVHSVYASQYFPGTALLHVPARLVGAPHWLTSLLLSAAALTLIFVLVRELFDDALLGLTATVISAGAHPLRLCSILATSQAPALLLTLAAYVCFVYWRRSKASGWLVGLGLASGWLLVTRPLDAVALLLPVAAALLWLLRRAHPLQWTALLAPVLLFVALQLTLNVGITGHPLKTPFDLYAQRDMPGVSWGLFREYVPREPQTLIPQKQEFYRGMKRSVAESSFGKHLAEMLGTAGIYLIRDLMADPLPFAGIPAGIVLLLHARRWRTAVLCTAGGLGFIVLFATYPLQSPHYYIVVIPAMAILTVAGLRATALAVAPRDASAAQTGIAIVFIAWSIFSLPEFSRGRIEFNFPNYQELALQQFERTLGNERALIFIRYSAGDEVDQEVVYNIGRARIEDNTIVRAHDLDQEQNQKLLAHYAAIQPQRMVYRFNRKDGSFSQLGRVSDLHRAVPQREQSGTSGPTIAPNP